MLKVYIWRWMLKVHQFSHHYSHSSPDNESLYIATSLRRATNKSRYFLSAHHARPLLPHRVLGISTPSGRAKWIRSYIIKGLNKRMIILFLSKWIIWSWLELMGDRWNFWQIDSGKFINIRGRGLNTWWDEILNSDRIFWARSTKLGEVSTDGRILDILAWFFGPIIFYPTDIFFLTRVPPYEKRSQNFQLHLRKKFV